MKSKLLLIALLAIIISTGVSAQKTWTGTTSTAWSTSTNWSPAGAPTAADNVTIPSAPSNQPLLSGTTGVCNNLTINAGASLTISGTSSNNALLTASGNTIIYGSFSIGSAITHTGTFTAVNVTWASGSSMTGAINGGINVSGNWEFATGSSVSMGYSTVTFTGSNNSTITSNSANSNFYGLVVNKTGGAIVYIGAASTSALAINGAINIGSGAVLNGQANITTILKGNLVNSGNINMGSGTLSFEKTSGTQSIQININDYFNSININTGGTVTISTSYIMQLMGNMTIQAGVLDAGASTIGLFGNWTNNVGTSGFTEGTGTVIFNGGNVHQYCSSENFYNLEVHKAIGGALRVNGTTVTCSHYNWTAGPVDVLNGGTFTANDLTDDAIAGSFYCNANCTINLYNYGGNIDLRGNLYIYGGNFNVYGGNNPSWWPYQGNAAITMSGGVLNFVDQGILIRTDASYTFTNNITGGTIKTAGSFTNGRSDFNPAAGTVELYGSANTNLTMNAGNLYNLAINKATANTVTLATNVTVNGLLTVQSGTFLATGKILFTNGNISVNNGGTLWIENGSVLRVKGTKAITVANGGTLKAIGTSVSKPIITDNAASGHHEFHVYGTISARYAIFEYNHGINIYSTATVDPLNPFDQCTFSYGVDRFLYFSNSQELIIRGANFPTAPVFNNVWKQNNSGSIEFRSATGAYAGSAYENDPYNLISWTTATPGLWTGLFSTSWMTPENWDNNMVPDSSTDVVIPQNVPNMPLISDATAYCRDLILETGTALTMADNSYLNIFRDFDSHLGQFTMNGSSYLYFTGSEDTFWYSDPYDVYRNIRITKADAYTVAQSQGTIICSGTFEIREGTFTLQFLTITNLGANALEIESGGILHFLTPFSYVEVYGSCIGYSGSEILGNGSLLCKGDFTLESNASNSWLCELIMNGTGTQYIDLQYPDAELGGLVIDKPGGICYIKSGDLSVSDITIYSGTLSCNNGPSPTATYDIVCDGDFVNQAGPAGFDASAGTVEFTSWRSIISPNGTIFNNLEINLLNSNLNITGEVTCASYDWTSGGIEVDEGATFTANDLTDNAIKGTFICQEGATINLTNSGTGTFVDLAGELYNYGGTINLFGSVSYWPYGNNAKVKMTSGIIDLKTCGLNIYQTSAYTLIDSISGGIIRTANNFTCTRTDFNPEGGTFEFYGGGNTVAISQIAGSSFYNVLINKNPGNTVALSSNIRLTNNLSIQSGLFNSNNRTIQLEGDWNNTAGPDAFLEGTGRVIFTGIYPQLCSTETFNILEIDKALQYFYDQTGSSITCQVYDWTQGGIWIAGGSTFYASDLADDGIYGEYVLWGNSIELHQDAIQSIDLHGTLNINGGEFKVYGGAFQSFWGSYANAGLTMTNGVLDFVDQAILIQDVAPYSFTSNISGGIIRTQKGFMAQSPGFNPFGGMVEIYGNQNSLILAQDGAEFYNLNINTSPLPVISHLYSSTINNTLSVDNGTVDVPFGSTVNCGNIAIGDGGDFRVSSSTIKLKNSGSLNVNSGGYLYLYGNEGTLSTLTGITPADRYSFNVNPGGWMLTNHTVFENMDDQGIYIAPEATLALTEAFYNCEFRNGESGPCTLLSIENDQDVVIENAVFPANTWGGQFNVRKSVDQGSVSFINATGAFAGEAFEDDPYSRIHWGEPKQLNLTLFLEGLYDGPNTMRQASNENGPQFGEGIADEIRVEFRNASDYYEMEYFVENVKLGTNGQASVNLPANLTATYYITIRHRNSIETTTTSPVSLAPGIINYSFDGPSKAYGGNLLQMITGQYAIYSGDVNQDGIVDTGDITPVDNDAANYAAGYLVSDVNGDGITDTADMTIVDNNAAGYVGAVIP